MLNKESIVVVTFMRREHYQLSLFKEAFPFMPLINEEKTEFPTVNNLIIEVI